MYCGLLLSLLLSGSVTLVNAGYDRELFSADVTLIGQTTKIVILTLFVVLVAYQARYTRRVITALVQHELTSRQAKESLDWEMGLASQVQSQLLPHDLPKIPGLACAGAVRQGRAVGGDYYDALEVQDGTLLVVVADVSGKGAPAALIMSEVRAAVHLLAEEFQGLEAFVERLNNLIFRSTDRKTFVTFLAVHIMPHRGEVQYVCAGHVPPMVASSDGVRRLPRGTMPLGVMPTLPEVPTRSMPFRTGDILVCCTDGILEHTDAVGDQFGEDRLAAYLGHHASEDAQTLLDGIFRHVSEFGNGKELEDDATIAVMASVPRG
jgi:sigma-B regulation protein RsbU (phosphoserine phosphatase)